MTVLKVEHLYKKFRKKVAILDLSFEVEKGEVFGLVGPNGSGKSTTIGMVLGLITPTGGRIELLGKNVRTELISVSHRVGTTRENPSFYPYLSGRDNLAFFSRIRSNGIEGSIDDVLRMVNLYSCAEDKVGTYSQGMKQRLQIAGAILHDPDFLILDEPTNGLDPLGIREVRKLILKLKEKGKTILLASHLLSEVEQLCDRIAIIKAGRLLTCGKTTELFQGKSLEDFYVEVVSENGETGWC
jgi:ABC-2 type transport system ATP-binding protein